MNGTVCAAISKSKTTIGGVRLMIMRVLLIYMFVASVITILIGGVLTGMVMPMMFAYMIKGMIGV